MYRDQNMFSTDLKPIALELWSVSDKKVSLMITQQYFSRGLYALTSETARSLIRSALSLSQDLVVTLCVVFPTV